MARFARFILFVLLSALAPSFGFAQRIDLNAETQPLYEYVQAHPSDWAKKMDLAYLFSEGREYARAIALYEDVLQNNSGNPRALNELCYLYTLTRERDKAYKSCAELTQAAPESHLSFDNQGLSFYQFGDYFAAQQAFVRAQNLAPDSWLVKTHVGMALLADGQFQLARDLYSRWLGGFSGGIEDQAVLFYGLYTAETALKNYEAAYSAIAKTSALTQNPLYWGQRIKAFLRCHELAFFLLFSGLSLALCAYLGKRLNRFLKNEV